MLTALAQHSQFGSDSSWVSTYRDKGWLHAHPRWAASAPQASVFPADMDIFGKCRQDFENPAVFAADTELSQPNI